MTHPHQPTTPASLGLFRPQALYLAGPMTGLPQHNRPAFDAAAAQLRAAGYTVFNPTENGLPVDAEWAQHMRADIRGLCICEAIALLPGAATSSSRGVALEMHLAGALGLPVAEVPQWAALAAVEAGADVAEALEGTA